MEAQSFCWPNFLLSVWNTALEVFKHPAWIGIAAVGSVTLAILALRPIFKERRDNAARAMNLRARLLNELTLIVPVIEEHRKLGPMFVSKADLIKLGELIRPFEALFSQAHILRPKEHDIVASLVIKLLTYVRTFPFSQETIREVSSLMKKVFIELERGGFLKGSVEKLKLPWSSREDKGGSGT